MRTFAEQDALYAQGRTKLFDANGNRLGRVTNAKGGQSYHNFGTAFDIVLIIGRNASWDMVSDFDNDKKSDWMEVTDILLSNGFEWGGLWKTFKDYPHFQKTFGYSTNDMLEIVKKGDVITETINGIQYVYPKL